MFYNFTLCENYIYNESYEIVIFYFIKNNFQKILSLTLILDFEKEFIFYILRLIEFLKKILLILMLDKNYDII